LGFHGWKDALGVETLEAMVRDEGCVKFLSFPANLVATGTRGVLREIVKRLFVDVVVTTCGTLDTMWLGVGGIIFGFSLWMVRCFGNRV